MQKCTSPLLYIEFQTGLIKVVLKSTEYFIKERGEVFE